MNRAWQRVVEFLNIPMNLLFRKIYFLYGLAACSDLVHTYAVYKSASYDLSEKAEAFFGFTLLFLLMIKAVYEFSRWLVQLIRDRIRVGYW